MRQRASSHRAAAVQNGAEGHGTALSGFSEGGCEFEGEMHGASLVGEDCGVVELGLDFQLFVFLVLCSSFSGLWVGGSVFFWTTVRRINRAGGCECSNACKGGLRLFRNKKKLALPCEWASGLALQVGAADRRVDEI